MVVYISWKTFNQLKKKELRVLNNRRPNKLKRRQVMLAEVMTDYIGAQTSPFRCKIFLIHPKKPQCIKIIFSNLFHSQPSLGTARILPQHTAFNLRLSSGGFISIFYFRAFQTFLFNSSSWLIVSRYR